MSINSINFLGSIASAVLPAYVLARVSTKSGDSFLVRMRKIAVSIPTMLLLAKHGQFIGKAWFISDRSVASRCCGMLVGAAFAAEGIRASRTSVENLLAGFCGPSLVRIGELVNKNLLSAPLNAVEKGIEFSYKAAMETTWDRAKEIVWSAPSKFPTTKDWSCAKETYHDLPKACKQLQRYLARA